MLKVELHAHTVHDRADRIRHTTRDLVEHALSLGYHALAITLHDIQRDNAADAAWARERGFVLLSGVERTVHGAHILLINFPADLALQVTRFDDIPRLKAACPQGIVVVPHPFYPVGSAMRSRLDAHASWVDAVEVNAMYTRHLDFNTPRDRVGQGSAASRSSATPTCTTCSRWVRPSRWSTPRPTRTPSATPSVRVAWKCTPHRSHRSGRRGSSRGCSSAACCRPIDKE